MTAAVAPTNVIPSHSLTVNFHLCPLCPPHRAEPSQSPWCSASPLAYRGNLCHTRAFSLITSVHFLCVLFFRNQRKRVGFYFFCTQSTTLRTGSAEHVEAALSRGPWTQADVKTKEKNNNRTEVLKPALGFSALLLRCGC